MRRAGQRVRTRIGAKWGRGDCCCIAVPPLSHIIEPLIDHSLHYDQGGEVEGARTLRHGGTTYCKVQAFNYRAVAGERMRGGSPELPTSKPHPLRLFLVQSYNYCRVSSRLSHYAKSISITYGSKQIQHHHYRLHNLFVMVFTFQVLRMKPAHYVLLPKGCSDFTFSLPVTQCRLKLVEESTPQKYEKPSCR